MAALPRLSPNAEHRVLKAVCGLPPRLQRRLFGAPLSIDGQTLASDIHALLRMAEMSGGGSGIAAGTPVAEARLGERQDAEVVAPRPPPRMARGETIEPPGPTAPLGPRLYVPPGLPDGEAAPLLLY